MISFEMLRQTHVAGRTVEEVVPTANPTDAAAVAMKLLLVVIVVEFALVAKVLAEHSLALHARLGDALAGGARGAHDLLDILSLEHVVLGGVVAKATPVRLFTAGRL